MNARSVILATIGVVLLCPALVLDEVVSLPRDAAWYEIDLTDEYANVVYYATDTTDEIGRAVLGGQMWVYTYGIDSPEAWPPEVHPPEVVPDSQPDLYCTAALDVLPRLDPDRGEPATRDRPDVAQRGESALLRGPLCRRSGQSTLEPAPLLQGILQHGNGHRKISR